MSVVYHIRAPCSNCSTNLDATWQVHLWDPMKNCVRWRSATPRGKRDLEVEPPSLNMIANCSCQLANRNEERFRLFPNYFGLVQKVVSRFWWDVLWRGPGYNRLEFGDCGNYCQLDVLRVTNRTPHSYCPAWTCMWDTRTPSPPHTHTHDWSCRRWLVVAGRFATAGIVPDKLSYRFVAGRDLSWGICQIFTGGSEFWPHLHDAVLRMRTVIFFKINKAGIVCA